MEITPPFGYKKITPLLPQMRVRRPSGTLPDYACQRNSLPLAVIEVMAAGHDYPIAFFPNGASHVPIAIVGVEPAENLFAQPAGWEPGFYIPACVRRYPYCMTRVTAQDNLQTQWVICVEEEFIDPEGVANFDEEGKPTAAFIEARDFLRQFEYELERSNEICQILTDYKLFEPMSAEVRIGESRFEYVGLFRIAEARLLHLTSNQLKTLVKKG